ncbi:MAG: hypothetical protein CMJ89_11615 [Planctomycetes bacterium]|jgi:hypothetical protein|nr:hypothetical protein [Planctomycetota bacterium]
MTARSLLLLSVSVLSSCGSDGPSSENPWRSQRAEFLEIAERLERSGNDWIGLSAAERLRAQLAAPGLSVSERRKLESRLAERLLREGEVEEAIELLESLLAGTPADGPAVAGLHRRLGIAWMRLAEVENCVRRHNAECCIFPLAGGGVHAAPDPARKASSHLLRFLESKPTNLKVRWLVNVLAMALGEYPGGVPENLVIPPSAFESEREFARFRDVAPDLGVDAFSLCGGVAIEDFDGDARLDILTSSYDPEEELRLFLNAGAAGFEEASVAFGTSDQLGGFNVITADYDADGDVDVLVLRGAWLGVDGGIRNSLLQNREGRFHDVSRAAGVAEPARPTQAAVFGDFDDDGVLDLFIGNESLREADPRQDFPSQLFQGRGDGTFEDVAASAGVTNDRYCKALTAGDYDNDGDLDLYLSNFGKNRLFRNDGGARFHDVGPELEVEEPDGRSFATWFFDRDNDGWLDLFVASYEGSIADVCAEALGKERSSPRPRLYRNEGASFRDVAREVGLDRFILPMGANFGDLDNDGFLDLYLTTGDPQLESIMPNVMLRNAGGETFEDVTTSGGFGHLQKGHGVAFADLDQDGDQDIYHQLGGFYLGDRFHNALFENPGNTNRFLHLKLVGVRSNRTGVGARVLVGVRDASGTREIHRAVGSVSSFGGSPLHLEIGLGAALAIERLVVSWPGKKGRDVFEEVPLDSYLRITEGESTFEVLPLEGFRFSSGN